MRWYFTFGQGHKHPQTGEKMKDYWVEIEAKDEQTAFSIMNAHYGMKWAMQYDENNFAERWYPKGCYEVIGNKQYFYTSILNR